MLKHCKTSQDQSTSCVQTQCFLNYFLIGPMGSGKSTVGRLLAEKLGYRFIDTDTEIEARYHSSIATIFKIEGEDYFRTCETMILSEVSANYRIVVATGGGIVLNSKNRNILSARGKVVYLQTSPNLQYLRTQGDDSRPLLQVNNREQLLLHHFLHRKPLYEGLADWIICTDNATPEEIVDCLYNKIVAL